MNNANLGRGLETLLNYANEQYMSKGIAMIQKISTPWTVVRQGNHIVSAFPDSASTVDYMGDIAGDSVCFEAKQTKVETAFPLKNIEPHQIDFMRKWGGIKFFIIEFVEHQEIYRVEWDLVIHYWDQHEKASGRASIPYRDMKGEKLVKPGRGIVLDYLEGVI